MRGTVGGRLPQGERPRDYRHPEANPARGGTPAVFIPVETRNGMPFKPYVYRGTGPCAEPITGPVIGPGLCGCGCGGEAPVSSRTDKRYGAIKGKPRRFIQGHNVSNPPGNAA